MESQRATGSSLEFLENVKVDLFPDEVYLFTPEGRHPVAAAQFHRARLRLCGAYRRRQPCGRRARGQASSCRCARKLASGQTRRDHHRQVGARRRPQWLEFVVTGKARTAIRQQLKHLEHEDAVRLGHRMLDRALERPRHLAGPRCR